MERPSDTIDDLKVQFAVIAIETGARKLGITPGEFAQRLHRQGLIENRLFKYYNALHTQSQNYVADDIVETLLNYEKE